MPGLATPSHTLASLIPDPEVEAKNHRRRFRVQDKLRILAQFDHCTNSNEVGALLRREGLYSSHLTAWRKQRQQGKLSSTHPQKRGCKEKEVNLFAKELLRLQRENQALHLKLKQAELEFRSLRGPYQAVSQELNNFVQLIRRSRG